MVNEFQEIDFHDYLMYSTPCRNARADAMIDTVISEENHAEREFESDMKIMSTR